uniref:Uncharacterized protein n=1 Tax=Anopheles maculatus TaxID=74869 RepID=A0A182SVG8_9DIPT
WRWFLPSNLQRRRNDRGECDDRCFFAFFQPFDAARYCGSAGGRKCNPFVRSCGCVRCAVFINCGGIMLAKFYHSKNIGFLKKCGKTGSGGGVLVVILVFRFMSLLPLEPNEDTWSSLL